MLIQFRCPYCSGKFEADSEELEDIVRGAEEEESELFLVLVNDKGRKVKFDPNTDPKLIEEWKKKGFRVEGEPAESQPSSQQSSPPSQKDQKDQKDQKKK